MPARVSVGGHVRREEDGGAAGHPTHGRVSGSSTPINPLSVATGHADAFSVGEGSTAIV